MSNKLNLKNRKILITLGATIEDIDPVRFITNRSSGKQGLAIAEAAIMQGARPILIIGNISINISKKIKNNSDIFYVRSALDMLAKVKENIKNTDIAIFAAAVADWRPKNYNQQKLKKDINVNELQIDFIKNPDILQIICNDKNLKPKITIGFAAETENIIENGKNKLHNKNCDYIIANDVSANSEGGFEKNKNSVYIMSKAGIVDYIENKSKKFIGKKIINLIN